MTSRPAAGWVLLPAACFLTALPSLAGVPLGGGVVVADDPAAASIGAEVLETGGNAVDAAVATAFALAVTYPQAGNLGGGGFLLFRAPEGRSWVIDFREVAPAAARRDMFLGPGGEPIPRRSREGPLSVGVPGSVAGLALAQRRFGSWPLSRVIEPARRLAAEGFPIPSGLAEALARHHERLRADPYTARVFTRGDRPYGAGEILVQPDLAWTLRRIAEDGAEGFYRGEAAQRLAAGIGRLDDGITLEDLAAYRPEERAPLRASYRGRIVLTTPPPSAGGVALLQMLHILSGFDLASAGPGSTLTLHRLASAMKLAFADRYRHLGDPAFVTVPLANLLSPEYADGLRRRIPTGRSLPSDSLASGPTAIREGGETTHVSVIDARGGAVSLTTTLNSTFGAALAVEGLGYLLNNEMDDFTTAPGRPNLYGLVEGEPNAVAPGKRMASSMCPTMILTDGVPTLVLGSPGGPRIPTSVLQVILNVVDFGLDLPAAVTAPRVHHQWLPDTLWLEHGGLGEKSVGALEAMGYTVDHRESIGSVMAAGVDPDTGAVSGQADPRRYGVAAMASLAPARRAAR